MVSSSYGLNSYSFHEWKKREDILNNLKRYVQVIELPYPNYNGLPGLEENMLNTQLSISWIPLKTLQQQIENDFKLLPEFRKYKIDNSYYEN